MIGRTFINKPNKDGEHFLTRTICQIHDNSKEGPSHEDANSLLQLDSKKTDEICAFNEFIDQVYSQFENESTQSPDTFWRFRSINGSKDPKYNILVEWETGETYWKPPSTIAKERPDTCTAYAKEKGILYFDGWKQLKTMAKRQKDMLRAIDQSKLFQIQRSTRFKFELQVPRAYAGAGKLDRTNGSSKWKNAIQLEIDMKDANHPFFDNGKTIFQGSNLLNTPDGHIKISVYLICDVRRKARLVTEGYLTGELVESNYSSMIYLKSLRFVTFLNETNQLELWEIDIFNVYMKEYINEKVFSTTGGEVVDRKVHILIIKRALYGLKTSEKRWHERLATCMEELEFVRCKTNQDTWMQPATDNSRNEYVAGYVDDLLINMKEPKTFGDLIKTKFSFRLKEDSQIDFHLGLSYTRDSDGTLVLQPKKCIKMMMESYKNMFWRLLKQIIRALELDDHPEIDDLTLCDMDETAPYPTMIEQMQWLIPFGRFDIFSPVTTMSRYRAAPRNRYLPRLQRIFGYNIEVLPDDIPEPMGHDIILTTFVDANLYHEWVMGRALTGILHLINQTPFDWFCKRQSTVETATYGSEFVAARIAVEQIIDIRTTLRYFGVPVNEMTYMFGDNQSVITNSTLPHSQLNKRHIALSYHKVREAIASKMLGFFKISGKSNPSDIMSKHWGYSKVRDTLLPLLFWKGETDISMKQK